MKHSGDRLAGMKRIYADFIPVRTDPVDQMAGRPKFRSHGKLP